MQNVNNQASKFDAIMQQMYYKSIEVSNDPELIRLIEEQYAGEDRLLDISLLLHQYHITDTNSNIDSIYAYLPGEKKVIKSQQYKAVKDITAPEDYPWLRMIQSHERNISPFSLKDEIGSVNKYIFVYSKPIVDPENGNYLGELAINMDERVIYFSCLDALNNSQTSTTEIVDGNNIIVSGKKISNLGKSLTTINPDNPETVRSEEYALAPFTGYRFVSTLDIGVLTKDLMRLRDLIIKVCLIMMVISLALALVMSNKLYAPMRNLKDAMRKLSEGELTARADVKGKDEIAVLSSGFNSMADRIEGLIEELVTEKLLKKEAELEALQYQIAPHFMYNTLNSIKCAAFLQNAYEIADQLDAFIELLQSSINKRGAFITLKEELKLVQNYVLLQRFRYRDNFSVEYRIDPIMEDFYLPRLIIQPLVENSIFHGLDTKTDRNKIIVTSRVEEDKLVISVEDNGKGMSPEEQASIFEKKKGKKEQFNHIGINNIKERISLYYGSEGSIQCLSSRESGTTIIIKIPATADKDKYVIREEEAS
jgi:Predicted signal transduction protein with a C-terminal ATPase domain